MNTNNSWTVQQKDIRTWEQKVSQIIVVVNECSWERKVLGMKGIFIRIWSSSVAPQCDIARSPRWHLYWAKTTKTKGPGNECSPGMFPIGTFILGNERSWARKVRVPLPRACISWFSSVLCAFFESAQLTGGTTSTLSSVWINKMCSTVVDQFLHNFLTFTVYSVVYSLAFVDPFWAGQCQEKLRSVHGSHRSFKFKVLDSFPNFQGLEKVLENRSGSWKSLNFIFVVLESRHLGV